MRNEAEVREKFDEVFERELRKKLDDYLTTAPINCKYNCRQRVKSNGAVGFCFNPAILTRLEKPVFVCQDITTSQKCPGYECKNNEYTVREEFINDMKSPAVCGQKYPKLAVLLWFLQNIPEQEQPTRGARLCSLVKEMFRKFKEIVLMKWF